MTANDVLLCRQISALEHSSLHGKAPSSPPHRTQEPDGREGGKSLRARGEGGHQKTRPCKWTEQSSYEFMETEAASARPPWSYRDATVQKKLANFSKLLNNTAEKNHVDMSKRTQKEEKRRDPQSLEIITLMLHWVYKRNLIRWRTGWESKGLLWTGTCYWTSECCLEPEHLFSI